jgi:hypothetical protein
MPLHLCSYATRHRGLRNEGAVRPVAYVVFSAEGSRDDHNFPTGRSIFGPAGSRGT